MTSLGWKTFFNRISGLETMPQDMIPKEKIFANFLKEAEEVDVVYDIERKPYGTICTAKVSGSGRW